MYNDPAFQAVLKQDNPTYERFKTSELHTLVALLSSGGFTVVQVVAEMKKIFGEKWTKYSCFCVYFIKEIF